MISIMANFMSIGVSWFIIILTLTSFKSFKTDSTVVADSGGTVFTYFKFLVIACTNHK